MDRNSQQGYTSKRKTLLIVILVAIAAAAVLTGSLLFFSRLEMRDESIAGAGTAASRAALTEEDAALAEELGLDPTPPPEATQTSPFIYYNGQKYVYNDALSVLLIMGIDDDTVTEYEYYQNTAQCDFLLVAVFDHDKKTCTPIQLNRDAMTDIPFIGNSGTVIGTAHEQLALAHTYGKGLEDSCINTVNAVSMYMYNIGIDNYFSLTMDAIPVLNDLVGGVTVTIEDDFTGVDDTFIPGETITLLGDHAEKYVRARMNMTDDPTNIARMRRQRTYMTSLFTLLSDRFQQDSGFLLDAYGAISPYMVTDCTLEQLSDYANQFSDYTLLDFVVPEGEAVKGSVFMEFYTDDESLQEIVIDTFYVPAE